MSKVEIHYRTVTDRYRSARGDVRQTLLSTSEQSHLLRSDHVFPVTTAIKLETWDAFLKHPQPAPAMDFRKQRVLIEDDCPIPIPVDELPSAQQMQEELDGTYETAFQANAVAKASKADLANALLSTTGFVMIGIAALMAATAALVVIAGKFGH